MQKVHIYDRLKTLNIIRQFYHSVWWKSCWKNLQ